MSLNDAFFNLAPPTNMSVDESTGPKDNGSSQTNSEVTFITVVLAIVVAWILVALWTRVIENFTFGTLHLNGDSAWHALIVALTVTVVFIVTIWVVDQYGIIPGGLETDIEGIESPATRGREAIRNNNIANDSLRNRSFVPEI